jgi:hypothetical protein
VAWAVIYIPGDMQELPLRIKKKKVRSEGIKTETTQPQVGEERRGKGRACHPMSSQNGLSKWSLKVVSQNGLSKWSLKMVSQNGLSKWSLKMVSQNGLSKWSLKMVSQNGPSHF